jgi:hypothetical protein
MSNLGPPPRRKRSIWLWILIGLLAPCVLSCVGFAIFLSTDSGGEWFDDLQTEVSEQQTQQAD